MAFAHRFWGIFASFLFILSLTTGNGQIVISEFLASNGSSISDEDGASSDWIELFNTSTAALDLEGWHLTDRSTNLTAWTFPQTILLPGEFLVVFASEKDRATAGSELHTNFQLSRSGEYLALVKPNLELATEFAPAFPEVQPDEPYGFPMAANEVIVVDETDALKYLIPQDASLALSWTTKGFNDSAWTSGLSGIGYENSPADYAGLINTPIPGGTVTVYTRFSFNLASVPNWNKLTLKMKYDDGFIAYLNGAYIDGANEPARPTDYLSGASANHNDSEAVQFKRFDATHLLDQLQAGNNTLAIRGLNANNGSSSDMLTRPQLVASESFVNGTTAGHLTAATPGATNPNGLAAPISFSHNHQMFTTSLTVTVSTTLTGADLYYTLNDTAPTTNSTLYTGPITITAGATLNVAASLPTGGLSAPEFRRYTKVDAGLSGFDSSLPLVVVDTFSGGIPDTGQRFSVFSLIEPDETSGRTSLGLAPSVASTANLAIRGSSSGGFPKKQYKMELVDQGMEEVGFNLLGMGKESDWILYAPGRYDRNMIANNFMYEIARRMGQPAMNTRFIEVFLNDDNKTVDAGDYNGIYVLMESIKIDQNRVPIKKLSPDDTTEPRISGGYIVSIDRGDDNQYVYNRDPTNLMPDNNSVNVVNPKNDRMSQQQRDYIRDYTVAAVQALYGPNTTDPVTGYRAYFDEVAMADYHMLNSLAHNVDAFRLSAYYYKDRNGRFMGGPQWDFDRTLESDDGRDNDAFLIRGVGGSTLYYEYGWWSGFFGLEDFRVLHQDQWYKWRRTVLSETSLFQLIDDLEAEISEAYSRPGNDPLDEASKWAIGGYGTRYTTLNGEMNHLKGWLSDRLGAHDDAFGKPPRMNQHGGMAPRGFQLSFFLPTGGSAGNVYYTLDGSDPRLEGGAISSKAQVYSSPISLSESTRVSARIKYTTNTPFPFENTVDWSAVSETTFNINPPATSNNFIITEIHYNPFGPDANEQSNGFTNPDDFEFIEMMNISTNTIDLSGVAFTNGITFNFDDSPIILLNPGASIVLTPEDDAFALRYPGVSVAGRYGGQLDNNGETVELADRNGQLIQALSYPDQGRSDGLGHSLVVGSSSGRYEASAYMDSCEFHGSPGTTGSTACEDVVINEVLAHTDLPLTDSIELHNAGFLPVDISYWLLSDSSEYFKYQIAPGTIIQPGAYLAFTEHDFNPNGAWNSNPGGPVDTSRHFALSASNGDEVYLVAADINSNITRVADFTNFRATLNGESLGRFDNGDGEFYPMGKRTLAAENTHVRVGPIVVTEIMYNPTASTNDFDLEYIELGNIGDLAEDLGAWELDEGVEYTFPGNTMIAPGETRVIVGFDPNDGAKLTAFQNAYGVVTPLGPWSGRLNNAGETILLLRADDPPVDQPTFIPLIEEERLSYTSRAPWDSGADGTGLALGRLVERQLANTNVNWAAQVPSLGIMPSQNWIADHFTPPEQGNVLVSGPDADPDADGLSNEEEYILGTNPRDGDSGLLLTPMILPYSLSWPSVEGRAYYVAFRLSLTEGSWQRIPGTRQFGTGGALQWTDTDPDRVQSERKGYYVVIVE